MIDDHFDHQRRFVAARTAVTPIPSPQRSYRCAPNMNHRHEIERLIADKQPAEAAECWRRMPTDGPGHVELARRVAQELVAAGDTGTAEAVLTELAASKPNLVWMLQLRAQLAAKRGDPAGVVTPLRRVFELQPESPAAAARAFAPR